MSVSPPAVARLIASVVILGALAWLYQAGLLALCRANPWVELGVSIVLPLVVIGGGFAAGALPRLVQLVVFESIFNVLAVTARFAVPGGWSWTWLLGWGFVVFFVLQASGFVADQARKRSWLALGQSVLGFGLVMSWWWSLGPHPTPAVDALGRLYIWGEPEPLWLRITYVVWVVSPLLSASTALPRLHQAVVHVASVGVAFSSGEFFHARLLTACHLLVLDVLFRYGAPSEANAHDPFCTLPAAVMPAYDRWVRPAVAGVGALAVLAIAIGRLFGLTS